MRLKNKIAVITGGNSGIGFAIAKAFKKEGAKGSIVGRNQKRLDTCIKELDLDFLALKGDVTNVLDLDNVFRQTINKFGKLDILVVNAGGAVGSATIGSVVDTSEEDYMQTIDLNLKSVFFTVQKALPYMKDGASIVLVSSIAADKAFSGMSVYSAAKAGVRSFARSFSADLLERNIRVNVLTPGPTQTPLFNKMGLSDEVIEESKKGLEEMIPLKRLGTSQEMAKVAVFLASDDSSFMLGEEIIVDGGVSNF